MTKRYAFVVPRFGPGSGGAETLVSEIAKRLSARGDQISILTTCARDNRSWENSYPAGHTEEEGLSVFRYPVDDRDLNLWIPYQISISEGINPGIEAQLDWWQHSVNSSDLYHHLAQNSENYDAIFFAPYLFGTTFWGSLISPEKAILIPCLHDENCSYLETTKAMFGQVRGCIFNAKAEQDLSERIYGQVNGGVVGLGFDPIQRSFPHEFSEPFLQPGTQYLLYLGRKETGKNGHKLIDNFILAKDTGVIPNDLKLVFCGGGSFSDLLRPASLSRSDIVDIGYLSSEDKRRLLASSLALVQPSRNESFSIVLMEAWQLGVPVIVDSQCSVTRDHVLEANGGLYYADAQEFGLVVKALIENPNLCRALGNSGRKYVERSYNWTQVLSRFDSVVNQIMGS